MKNEWLKLRNVEKNLQKKVENFLTKKWNFVELKQTVLHYCIRWRQILQKSFDIENKHNFEK